MDIEMYERDIEKYDKKSVLKYKERYSRLNELYKAKSKSLSDLKQKYNIKDSGFDASAKVDQYMYALAKNNTKLDDAIRAGAESENIAKDIKVNLNAQGDKMLKMERNLHEMDKELSTADRFIKIISCNEKKNSIILYFVVFLLIAGIGLIIYFKFFNKL